VKAEVRTNEPLGADEWEEGLCGLLDCLVECLRGRVAVLVENLVLCEEHALCKKYQSSTAWVGSKVRVLNTTR
jgi:hypothetical protein